jgi:N-hydroxyarylamine O-acetyltransferase
MELDRYLARIGYSGPRTPTHQVLRQLHRAHLFSVPFENLSIAWDEPIYLNDVAHYWKIVEARRGGFCYELNGLFAWALRSMGFKVTLLGAQVYSRENGGDGYGPELSHLLLRVDLEVPVVVDVGFGDSFLNPLPLRIATVVEESEHRAFRFVQEDGFFVLQMREGEEGAFAPRYRFSLTPRSIEEFDEMCDYHQTSPESPFTRRRIITLARPDGRSTLVDRRLIETAADGSTVEQEFETDEDADRVLLEMFGIVAPRIAPWPVQGTDETIEEKDDHDVSPPDL